MNKKGKIALGVIGLGVVISVVGLAFNRKRTNPLPPGYNLGVTLANYGPSATQWEMMVIDNTVSSMLSQLALPVAQRAVFNIPQTWAMPLRISINIYKPTTWEGQPVLTQIFGVQSYREIDITGNPDPTYQPIFVTDLGNLAFDVDAMTFVSA
jgi:hypothetical protein